LENKPFSNVVFKECIAEPIPNLCRNMTPQVSSNRRLIASPSLKSNFGPVAIIRKSPIINQRDSGLGKVFGSSKKEKIDLRTYQIIYEVIEDIKKAISGLLKPKEVEEPVGEAEIRRVFTLSNGQAIAGCLVAKGKVIRGARARLVRGEKVLADDKIASLRRFKDNAREVGVNFECGIQLENFNDFKAGDRFQIYRIVEQKQ